MSNQHRPEIAVVGSLNLDVVFPVDRLPERGETVLGGESAQHPGGKGANQAVAAARLDRRVAMIGRTGSDTAGQMLRQSLTDAGVDVSHVGESDVATGTAVIAVEAGGENMIIVSPGANASVTPDDVNAAREVLEAAQVTLIQLEIPVAAALAAIEASTGTVVLNPAPAQHLPFNVLRSVDVLVPNRTELMALAGRETFPDNASDVVHMAQELPSPTVVVTLGAEGALVVSGTSSTRIPAPAVDAVDATAAGDAFCGALADGLCRGLSIAAATRRAVFAGALTATRHGAQPSLPTSPELSKFIQEMT